MLTKFCVGSGRYISGYVAKLCVIVFIAGLSWPVFSSTEEYCADQWPDDYRMQAACIERQDKAAIEFDALTEKYVNGNIAFDKILFKCLEDWHKPKFHTWDFFMATACFQDQVEAYKSIQARKQTTGYSGKQHTPTPKPPKHALAGLDKLFVILKLNDRSGQGMRPRKERIKQSALLKHLKGALASKFSRRSGLKLYQPGSTNLRVTIEITSDRKSRHYYINITATLKRDGAEWQISKSDYWGEQKNMTPVLLARDKITKILKTLRSDEFTYVQLRGMPYHAPCHRSIACHLCASNREVTLHSYKSRVSGGQAKLAAAQKVLDGAMSRLGIVYTITELQSRIASEFFGSFIAAN